MDSKRVALLGVVSSIALVGFAYVRSERKSVAAEIAGLKTQLLALRAESHESAEATADNGAAVRALAQSVATMPLTPPSSPPPAAASDRPEEREPVPAPKSRREVQDELQLTFEHDRRDPTWATSEKRATTEKLTAVLPEGSSLVSVDCGEKICRVETTHPDLAHFDAFARSAFVMPAQPVFAGGGTLVRVDPTDGNGPLSMISYASRTQESAN